MRAVIEPRPQIAANFAHPMPVTSDKTLIEGANALAAVETDQRSGKRDRRSAKPYLV
jgi:hypothetical protein